MISQFDESEFFRMLNGRLVAAAVAKSAERGSLAKVIKASGLSGVTVWRGYSDLSADTPGERSDGSIRTRRAGGGRKRTGGDTMKTALKKIVEPHVRGNPVGPLTWVSKSLRKLATALAEKGFKACHVTVGRLLRELDFTLQSNKKSHEGGSSPHRDEQFRFINATAAHFLSLGLPVISVDAKKKELVVNLIGSTTSKSGLKVVAASTRKAYKTGIRIADETLKGLNMCSQVADGPEQIRRWNYLFRPQSQTD